MNEAPDAPAARRRLPALLAKLKTSPFFKNILLIMTGTGLAQLIGFVLTPVISRLFTPADFGLYGSFDALAGVLAAAATLEYSQAIMLPKEKEDAINLLAVAFFSTLAVGALALLFCLAAPGTVNRVMKIRGFWPLALLVLATLVSGFNQSFQAWSVRVKAFKHTSASQVIRSVASNGGKIGFGTLKLGYAGLIISAILSNILASLNLFRVFLPDLKALRGSIRWGRMKELAREYRDFPQYAASQNVVNAMSTGLPVLLLTHFFGISVAGAYAFGVSILSVPMGFILTAFRQVLFQKASETHHRVGSLANLYVKTTAALLAMALVPSLVLIIWAPQIFSLVFGAKWSTAGDMARSLIIWLAVSFCNLPAVLFARIIRIQRFIFFYDLALLAARAAALVVGGLLFNARLTVVFFSIVGSLMNAYLIIHVGRAVMKKEGASNWGRILDILKEE